MPHKRHKGLRSLAKEAAVGLAGAIARVPDAMTAAVIVGVSPVHGLYASAAGTITGGLASGTTLMVITTTTAAALAADSALSGVPEGDRVAALLLLTMLAGLFMLAAAVLRLGRHTRFVSHSVMIGFLTGVSANIILRQLGNLAGLEAEGENALARAWSVLREIGAVHLDSLLTGLAAIALMVLIGSTRLSTAAALAAVVVPTAVARLLGADEATVADIGAIPAGLPVPRLPEVGLLSFDLVAGAASVAVIVLVQGAGVSESTPNPGSRSPRNDRDFAAQGVANLAAGVFGGQPVGGSIGQTAFNRASHARTRWAGVISGVWMLLILAAFAPLLGSVAMPALAGLLIYAAARAIRPTEIATIMRTGNAARAAFAVTAVSALLLPLSTAVGIGVTLSLVLQLNRDAMDLRVVRLRELDDGRMLEAPAPRTLGSNQVTVLDVYGSLLYAGSRTLAAKLPDPDGAQRPAVVLRLRGRTGLGATFYRVVNDYAHALAERGGRLYLSGLTPGLLEQLRASGAFTLSGPVVLVPATDIVGASTAKAVREAQSWLVEESD